METTKIKRKKVRIKLANINKMIVVRLPILIRMGTQRKKIFRRS